MPYLDKLRSGLELVLVDLPYFVLSSLVSSLDTLLVPYLGVMSSLDSWRDKEVLPPYLEPTSSLDSCLERDVLPLYFGVMSSLDS